MSKKKLINSFKYALNGFRLAYKKEKNLKIHIIIMFLVIILGIIFKISKMEWIICLILFALVISEELINTSIESVVDIIMPQTNPKAKIAKDVAASAVLVTAIFATIIGLIIFVPKIMNIWVIYNW